MKKLLGIFVVIALFGVAQTAKADICIGPGGINIGGNCPGHQPGPPPGPPPGHYPPPPPPHYPPPPPPYYPPAPPPYYPPAPPPPQPQQGYACFYRDSNFSGPSFCLQAGQNNYNLANNGWNDTISSIAIYGNAQVYVCINANFNGPCTTLERSVPDANQYIGPGWNDAISSIQVQY